ncbi:MAG TPA: glycosyltransferase, partial [Candidatus Berkiella sp.]|nr:glycosyltransferase [Candidatus Berkiella sp.]
KAKYLIHSSLAYETFGLTMVEAFAHQTPVIGLNYGTRKEMIEHGKNGFLCTKAELVPTILQSYDIANYEQLAFFAQECAQKFYTQSVMTQQIHLYQRILHEDAHA